MAMSDARKRANKKWNQAHSETLGIYVKKGVKDKCKALAENAGLSLGAYIIKAVIEKAINDGVISKEQAERLEDEDLEGTWLEETGLKN